ncbi:MAG: hypothetical protein WKF85_12130 [Chitinophagaceae bacterium]
MPIIIQKWENLINNTLNPMSASNRLTDDIIKSLIAESELEKENVRYLLIEAVVDRQKIGDKQQYVQVIQAMLIRLLDKLHYYKQNKGLENMQLYLYKTISQHLEEVLNFIEDFFSNYFDRNEKVPASYLLISIKELLGQLQQLNEILELKNATDTELTNILVNNFNAFCSKKFTAPSYHELIYQKDLMSELLSANVLKSENSIREALFYLNFNHGEYIVYLFDKLNTLTESLHSNKEKIATLKYEQKIINQLRTKLNTCLSTNMPPLKEQTNSWIEEEIKFLQTEPSFSIPIKTEIETEDKIQTSLSVTKLSLLIKLMVIDKIITNRVVAHVLRIVIRTVTTAQTNTITFNSLETKYHNPERGTISAVKEMLFRWINILNQL